MPSQALASQAVASLAMANHAAPSRAMGSYFVDAVTFFPWRSLRTVSS